MQSTFFLKFVGISILVLIALPVLLIALPNFIEFPAGMPYGLVIGVLFTQLAIPYFLLVVVLIITYIAFLSSYVKAKGRGNDADVAAMKEFFKNGKV